MPSRLENICKTLRGINRGKCTASMVNPGHLQHIANFDSYYRDKVRSVGWETPSLKRLREFHDANPPRVHVPAKPSYKYPYDFERVSVNIKSHKNGIKVSITQPFHELYENYQSKGIQPPVEERVRLMKLAGYPEHILVSLIKCDQRWKRNEQKNKLFLESIFGKK